MSAVCPASVCVPSTAGVPVVCVPPSASVHVPAAAAALPHRFFVNTEDIRDRVVALVSTSTASAPVVAQPAWAAGEGAIPAMLSTPGHATLRDLGRTVFLGGPLREVQVVAQGAAAPGPDNNFLRAFLRMPAGVVRLG